MRSTTSLFVILVTLLVPGQVAAEQSTLAPGDRVRIGVVDEPELTKEAVLDKDGSVALALVGMVKLSGMTCGEAAKGVQKALREYILRPEVSVELLERAKLQVTVAGEVRKPGSLSLEAEAHLLDALTSAEYTDKADLARITLHRGGQARHVDVHAFLAGGDADANLPLEPSDMIVVPVSEPTGSVLVAGEVGRPGLVTISHAIGLAEVLTACSGVNPGADTRAISVRRADGKETQTVDLQQLLANGSSPGIVLQAGDSVYVPKAAETYFIIQGGVNQPGKFPLNGDITLEEAAATAGGFSRDARTDSIQVFGAAGRAGSPQVINMNKTRSGSAPNYVVRSGDIVVVPVRNPRPDFWQVVTGVLSFGWVLK